MSTAATDPLATDLKTTDKVSHPRELYVLFFAEA